MSDHATLAPSAASRWMTCPGSVKLQGQAREVLGEETQSNFSAAGSAAHALAEKCLSEGVTPGTLLGDLIYTSDNGDEYFVNPDMIDKIVPYLEYIRSLEGDLYVEQKVHAGKSMPEVYGTADAIICRPGHLTMVDLKTGQGIKVDAHDNPQLMIYLLGAVRAFDPLYDFEEFTAVVSQPPLNHHSEVHITRNQLVEFAVELKAAVERIKNEPDTLVPSLDACRWCRARSFCPALGHAVEEAVTINLASATVAELGFAMGKVPLVQAWVSGVEDAVKELLLNGKEVPGFKVVAGRSSRAWRDENEVLEYLKAHVKRFKAIAFSEPKLLSPAQVEKAVKDANIVGLDLAPLIQVHPGKPTVAPKSDKREALVTGDRAANDFAEFV